jgi:hypothetical protein
VKRLIAVLAFALLPSLAFAQSAVRQSGSVNHNDLTKWDQTGILKAGGGLLGDNTGYGVNPFSITDNNGLALCANSGPTTAAYTTLCFGHDSSGNGLLSFDSDGITPAKTLNFNINGTTYTFPFAIGGIIGPGTTTPGNPACWNNTIGTLLKDCPLPSHITTAYTVAGTDMGTRLIADGAAFYPINFGAVGSYPANFSVTISNSDPVAAGSRARWINLNNAGYPVSCYLWPQQTVRVFSIGGAWNTDGCNQRYKLPSGNMTVYVNPALGSDVYGVSDGLLSGTGARKSFYDALTFILGQFDFEGGNSPPAGVSTQLTILGSGAADPNTIHFAPHSLVGADQTAGIAIDCGGGSLTGAPAAQFFYGARVKMQNCNIAPSGQNGIEVRSGAQVYLVGGMTFQSVCSTCAQMYASTGGQIQYSTNYGIAGGGGYHIFLEQGGYFVPFFAVSSPINVNFTGNFNFNQQFISASNLSFANLNQITWGTGTETGYAFSMRNYAVIDGLAGLPASLQRGGSVSQAPLEGPWAAHFAGSTSGDYDTSGVGTYVAHGNRVTASFAITATAAHSPIGGLRVTGLPIQSLYNSPADYGCLINYWNPTVTLDTGYTMLAATVDAGAATLTITESGSGVPTQILPVSKVTAPFEIHGVCSYLMNN